MDNNNICPENTRNLLNNNAIKEEYFEIKIPLHVFQYLSAENCDLQNLCRICLSIENEVIFPMWTAPDNNLLAELYTSLTAIPISPDDGLPSNICAACQAQISNFCEFKALCERSNYTLRSILKGEFTARDAIMENNVPSQNIQGTEDKNNLKEETELNEDIQYLEDLDEVPNANDGLYTEENVAKCEQEKLLSSATDTKSLFDEVVSQKPHKRRKNHVCSFCGKNYLKLKALRTHIKNNHESSNLHECNQCKEAFTSEHDLKLHSALHTNGTSWKCNKCDKEFSSKQVLRRHIRRHMEAKRFACELCGKRFPELYALRRHARVHTGQPPRKNHACTLCDKRFTCARQLAAHAWAHGGARACACACGKAFPSPRLLASHARVHEPHKPHACPYCDKRFRHASTRNTHVRTHTGEKPYVCAACGKAFIQNSNLTLHMRTHTGERPYACGECGRRFSSGSTLKAHARSHTGERPYSCTVCGKTFARMNMKAHMRMHTGERPYECSACPKKFVNASRLREHERVHTGEKPFQCAICPQNFPTKSHLVKHVKTHETPKKSAKRVLVRNPEIVVSNKIVISEKTATIEGLKTETVTAEETACRIVILDAEQVPLEVHLAC